MSNDRQDSDLKAENERLKREIQARDALADAGGNVQLGPMHVVKIMEKEGLSARKAVERMAADPEMGPLFNKAQPEEVELAKMSRREKVDYIENHGLDAYLKMVDRAYT